jgi:hypothetical protein
VVEGESVSEDQENDKADDTAPRSLELGLHQPFKEGAIANWNPGAVGDQDLVEMQGFMQLVDVLYPHLPILLAHDLPHETAQDDLVGGWGVEADDVEVCKLVVEAVEFLGLNHEQPVLLDADPAEHFYEVWMAIEFGHGVDELFTL